MRKLRSFFNVAIVALVVSGCVVDQPRPVVQVELSETEFSEAEIPGVAEARQRFVQAQRDRLKEVTTPPEDWTRIGGNNGGIYFAHPASTSHSNNTIKFWLLYNLFPDESDQYWHLDASSTPSLKSLYLVDCRSLSYQIKSHIMYRSSGGKGGQVDRVDYRDQENPPPDAGSFHDQLVSGLCKAAPHHQAKPIPVAWIRL